MLELNVLRREVTREVEPDERPRRRGCKPRRQQDTPSECTVVVDPEHDLNFRGACDCVACQREFAEAYRYVAAGFAAARGIQINVCECAHDSDEYLETDMHDRRIVGLCKTIHRALPWGRNSRALGCERKGSRVAVKSTRKRGRK